MAGIVFRPQDRCPSLGWPKPKLKWNITNVLTILNRINARQIELLLLSVYLGCDYEQFFVNYFNSGAYDGEGNTRKHVRVIALAGMESLTFVVDRIKGGPTREKGSTLVKKKK